MGDTEGKKWQPYQWTTEIYVYVNINLPVFIDIFDAWRLVRNMNLRPHYINYTFWKAIGMLTRLWEALV